MLRKDGPPLLHRLKRPFEHAEVEAQIIIDLKAHLLTELTVSQQKARQGIVTLRAEHEALKIDKRKNWLSFESINTKHIAIMAKSLAQTEHSVAFEANYMKNNLLSPILPLIWPVPLSLPIVNFVKLIILQMFQPLIPTLMPVSAIFTPTKTTRRTNRKKSCYKLSSPITHI